MNFSGTSIAFAPWVPWPVLIGLAIAALLLLVLTAVRGARGVGWRLLAFNPAKLGVPNPARRAKEKRPFETWRQIGVPDWVGEPRFACRDALAGCHSDDARRWIVCAT